MKKYRPLINFDGVKRFNNFENIQDLLYTTFEFGYKSGYNARIDKTCLKNDLDSSYKLDCDGERVTRVTEHEEEAFETELDKGYSIGYDEGYDEGFAQGIKKGYIERIEDGNEETCEEEWCECRALGYSQGVDTGYISGYKDGLLGNPAWITDTEIDELIKTSMR